MRISIVKNNIQSSVKKAIPYVLGAMALVGCAKPSAKLKEYCENTNKSAQEYIQIINGRKAYDETGYQAALDSLAYRDLLNGTKLANDSSTIADFNRISTTYRHRGPLDTCFVKEIIKTDISTKDYSNIINSTSPTKRQFLADTTFFGKFFREKGLMTKDLEAKFKAVSYFLNPSLNSDFGVIQSDYNKLRKK